VKKRGERGRMKRAREREGRRRKRSAWTGVGTDLSLPSKLVGQFKRRRKE
jgi:hypothetical protein